MYDVSGIIHTETGIDILCENDSLEEMLISLFNPDKQHDAGQAKKGNPQPQFFQQDRSMFSATAFREHQKYAEACPSCYHSHKGCISHPPPEAGRVG